MACNFCGKTLTHNPWEIRSRMKKITRRFCNKNCAARKDGIDPIKTRYRVLKIKGRRISEHRWVMEQHIGRKLRQFEYVHHLDGNKTNNCLSNLKIVSPREHGIEHTYYPIEKICVICGEKFIPHKTKRKIKRTCSKKCRYLLIAKTYHQNRRKKRSKS
jgi:HNH endonuclease